ncbi:MAG: 2-C-methyl-D-erythritol 4-phosphate cytidylyltransferase, partial [Verrucomicrobiota bacterium]|nr:2-C-methyl-D-erythritol 4-phosphate cytidylyltransferase [Verrucomicrobiota bacterium]
MKVALMVAAGKGQRMGSDKLWLELDGLPVVAHTWRHLDQAASVDQVVLVVRNESRASFEALGGGLGLRKPYTFVDGGAERQDSVWAGLQSCPSGTQWVAIQDAARPCTSTADCPPASVLQQGMTLWEPGAAAGSWRALLGARLLGSVPVP